MSKFRRAKGRCGPKVHHLRYVLHRPHLFLAARRRRIEVLHRLAHHEITILEKGAAITNYGWLERNLTDTEWLILQEQIESLPSDVGHLAQQHCFGRYR